MVPLVIQNNEFCAGEKFKQSILAILYKYLFEQKADLNTIYDKMKKEINAGSNLKIQLYSVCGKSLKNSTRNTYSGITLFMRGMTCQYG